MAILNLSLDPAAVLYRQKVLLRQRSEIAPDAVPLPSFSWGIERQRAGGMSEKAMVKQWMRYLAVAVAAAARQRRLNQLALVSLIEIGGDAQHFHFQLYCPFPEILQPLNDTAARLRLEKDGDLMNLDLHYKFALPETLCPMAFLYDRSKNSVLISNEHQIQDPIQFLAFDRCGSTSGFLNFIGSLNLLQTLRPEESGIDQLRIILRDAMAARSDEWLRWIYHLGDEQVLFDPAHILVRSSNPETYFYSYSGPAGSTSEGGSNGRT
jgi:hypothetical protein